jgi:hypothetical protein
MVLERDFVIVRPLANFYCVKLARQTGKVRSSTNLGGTPLGELRALLPSGRKLTSELQGTSNSKADAISALHREIRYVSSARRPHAVACVGE